MQGFLTWVTQLLQSKSVWVQILMFISEIILLATQTLPLSTEAISIMMFIHSSISIFMRSITTQPISAKPPLV